MSTFYDTIIRNSSAFHSDAVCKDMALLEPGTRTAIIALVDEAKQEGHDLRVLETYRSQTRQSALFAKHATQLHTVGCHGYGVAVDFGVFINGKYAENNTPYLFLRDLARKHNLISGQDWGHSRTGSFVDSGHVQRIPVWRQIALFNGSWYPPEVYNPYIDSAANGHLDVVASLNSDKPSFPTPIKTPIVSTHDTKWLQHNLNLLGQNPALVEDGINGHNTAKAIKDFQIKNKLEVTGLLGPEVVDKIDSLLTKKGN